jgi:hypothetical protein
MSRHLVTAGRLLAAALFAATIAAVVLAVAGVRDPWDLLHIVLSLVVYGLLVWLRRAARRRVASYGRRPLFTAEETADLDAWRSAATDWQRRGIRISRAYTDALVEQYPWDEPIRTIERRDGAR